MSVNVLQSNCGLSAGSNINCNSLALGYGMTLPSTTVTQLTSVTTAVTSNTLSGEIICFTSTLAAGLAEQFQVNCANVVAGDKVLVCISDYSGTIVTNGLPMVIVDTITSGSFQIVKINAAAANALAGVVKIQYVIVKV